MVLGKVSCCIPHGLNSLCHIFLQRMHHLLKAAQEREKATMQTLKQALPVTGQHWVATLNSQVQSNIFGTLELPNLKCLSTKKKAEILRDEPSAHMGSPLHWEEGGQEHQTSKPHVLMLLQSLSPTTSYCGAWKTPSSHTAELTAWCMEPMLLLQRWGILGWWQRLQYLSVQGAPTHHSRKIWAETA